MALSDIIHIIVNGQLLSASIHPYEVKWGPRNLNFGWLIRDLMQVLYIQHEPINISILARKSVPPAIALITTVVIASLLPMVARANY